MKINSFFNSIFWFVKNPFAETNMGFLQAALPYIASAGMSLAQSHFAGKQADRQRRRADEQAKQDKLLASFGQQPTQRPQQYQEQGIAQKILNDPITQSLVDELVNKDPDKLSQVPTGGMNDAARAAMRQSYDFANAARRRPMFGG